jgi:hemerythrin superfamily protein
MDALTLLKSDHDKVNDIFQQFKQGGTPAQFQRLFDQLRQELTIHTQLEEQVFYPEAGRFQEVAGMIQESYREHASVKEALVRIAPLDNSSSEWSSQMTQLMYDVQHHVAEEENHLFPELRQLMSDKQLQDLGRKLEQARLEALSGRASQTLPPDTSFYQQP